MVNILYLFIKFIFKAFENKIMDNYDFDCAGFDDMDYSFMDNEDFGLAKSFSTAPVGLLAPQVKLAGA